MAILAQAAAGAGRRLRRHLPRADGGGARRVPGQEDQRSSRTPAASIRAASPTRCAQLAKTLGARAAHRRRRGRRPRAASRRAARRRRALHAPRQARRSRLAIRSPPTPTSAAGPSPRRSHRGADIVVTGRVTDAALVVGPAAWKLRLAARRLGSPRRRRRRRPHHRVQRAGHRRQLQLLRRGRRARARSASPSPRCTRTARSSSPSTPAPAARVNVGTVTAQLLYEIDGAALLQPRRRRALRHHHAQRRGPDRVRGRGTRGEPPPPTLKVAINLAGGWRNSMRIRLAGLDPRRQGEPRRAARRRDVGRARAFADWHVSLDRRAEKIRATTKPRNRTSPSPSNRPTKRSWARRGRRASSACRCRACPGIRSRTRPRTRRPFSFTGRRWSTRRACRSPCTSKTRPSSSRRADDDHRARADPDAARRAARGQASVALGVRRSSRRRSAASSARARATKAATPTSASGDARRPRTPGSRTSLTVERLRALFPDLAPFTIDRAMLPNLHAANFTIRGILGDGVAASTRSDPQAKTLGEYVRARVVELPAELVG